MNEWPVRLTSEGPMELHEHKDLMGTPEDMVEKLRNAAPLNFELLDGIEDRLTCLEEQLHLYADRILVNKKDSSESHSSLGLYTPKSGAVIEADSTRKGGLDDIMRQEVDDAVKESRKKAVEYCEFPGFRRTELSELPNKLEAPPILHRVTKAQDFNPLFQGPLEPGFRKFWKKIFLSEASVAVMQDMFWWYFLYRYHKSEKSAQDQLFDRIADSFVALLNSINHEIKDKFFTVYPDCLAQAIYSAYWEAFPDSRPQFRDEFKQEIADLAHEWTSGVRPPAGTWKGWNVKRLEPKLPRAVQESKSKHIVQAASLNKHVKLSLDIDSFEKLINKLGEEETVGTAVVPGARSESQPNQMGSREVTRGTELTNATSYVPATLHTISQSRQAQCGTPRRDPKESSQMGPGPGFERVMFNLSGRSPLIAHYLHMKQLKSNVQPGRRVRRTEKSLEKEQLYQEPTYREIIEDSRQKSVKLGQEYKKICDVTHQEIMKVEKKRRETNREIDRLRKEVLLVRSNLELKILSEKILDKKDRESTIPRGIRKVSETADFTNGHDDDEEEEQ
ncbi:unnamed protein product [Owenia fusiformis]|uniref:Protein FAM227B n=1 Tax=Owenia fusiformis TaxID=6347 RepID=A0A8S4Q232_OWEFU|nr:unnamed protein product [Owenia fusiformis]